MWKRGVSNLGSLHKTEVRNPLQTMVNIKALFFLRYVSSNKKLATLSPTYFLKKMQGLYLHAISQIGTSNAFQKFKFGDGGSKVIN